MRIESLGLSLVIRSLGKPGLRETLSRGKGMKNYQQYSAFFFCSLRKNTLFPSCKFSNF